MLALEFLDPLSSIFGVFPTEGATESKERMSRVNGEWSHNDS